MLQFNLYLEKSKLYYWSFLSIFNNTICSSLSDTFKQPSFSYIWKDKSFYNSNNRRLLKVCTQLLFLLFNVSPWGKERGSWKYFSLRITWIKISLHYANRNLVSCILFNGWQNFVCIRKYLTSFIDLHTYYFKVTRPFSDKSFQWIN